MASTLAFGLGIPLTRPPTYHQQTRRTRRLARKPIPRAAVQQTDDNDPDPDSDPAHVPDTDIAELRRLSDLPLPPSIPVPPEPTTLTVEFAPGKSLTFETGRLARQARGAVIVRRKDTLCFCTACAEDSASPGLDFLPLRVDYGEKFSAMGRTSGSYVKREGRPSEREILVSRLIDRPLRPMFEKGYYCDAQVLANVYSYDADCPADALSICGASAALHISDIPLVAPVAGVRVGRVNGEFIIEPTAEESENTDCELVIAGTNEGILMIEGHAQFLSEEDILEGVRAAHEAIKKICNGIEELRKMTGSEEKQLSSIRVPTDELRERVRTHSSGIDEALAVIGKKAREVAVREVKESVFEALKPSREEHMQDPDSATEQLTLLRIAWKDFISDRMRRRILDENIRPDGRDCFTVRPITVDQSPLPRAHGSAVFTRGETQTLAVCTLGGEDMAQRFETLEGEDASRFYLQYSFPPFSVGEVGRIGAPGRREIGHGKLAERALLPTIPNREEFPYVMRVESNILESNGSSSMASVCGGCLALLDAGVPVKSSVAGVAMGLVIDEDVIDDETGYPRAVVLTDILGLEDALGCCDAKFAGNRTGLSALQLDVKLQGIPISLLERLLMQARAGRHHILDCMDAVMPRPKSKLPDAVPRVMNIQISPKRIGDVIGQGGKTIRSIIERCGGDDVIRISIENDGRVSFSSTDDAMIKKAVGVVEGLTLELDVGTKFKGRVTKILPFGAFIEVAEGKEGWLHISELEYKRTASVDDVCKVGDEMEVKVIELGRNGQFRVSRKACLPSERNGREDRDFSRRTVGSGEGRRGNGNASK